MNKQRFIVYDKTEALVCEGTIEEICKYLECDKPTVYIAFQKESKYNRKTCACIKGHKVYKEKYVYTGTDEWLKKYQ